MRKLNVRWLVGVVVSLILFGVLAYFLHEFQMKRNASVFVREAKRAQSEGRPEDAALHLRRYVKLAPNDTEGLILYGFQLADLNSVGPAYFSLEKAIQKSPDRSDVRRRLVELSLKLGRVPEAREHLENHLLKDSPHDSELLELLSTCQFQQDDIEGARASLVSAIENSPERVTTYVRLASLLNDKLNKSKEASDLINEMVQRNSENSRAYLFRAEWRLREFFQWKASTAAGATVEEEANKRRGDIENDVKRALELAPDATETLLVAARISQTFGQIEDARNLIQHGIEVLPKEPTFYIALADLETVDGNVRAAAEALKQGVAASPKDLDLKWRLANRLIETDDDAGAKELVQQLRTSKYRESLIGYLEGRLLIRRSEWTAAIAKFEPLRAEFRENPILGKQIDFWLGIAYRETNSPDQSLSSFRRAEALDPNWTQAKLAVAEMLTSAKQPDEAILEYRKICSQPDAPIAALLGLERSILQSNMSRTTDQKNWAEFDNTLKKLEQSNAPPAQVALLKAQKLIAAGKLPDAEKSIEQTLENNSDQIELWAVLIDLAQSRRDWERAERLIQDVEKKFGDNAFLRRLKGRLIALREPAERARELLQPLSQPASDWDEPQKLQLASEFALLFLTVGDYGDSEKLALQVDAALPKNLPIQLLLLDIATRTKQLKLMKRIIDEVHETTGEGALWHYGQALMLTMSGDETKDKQNYVTAISHLEKAIVTRPTWERVHTLWAEILERQGDTRVATEHYLKAIDLGENSTRITNRTLGLLLNAKRYEDADKLLRSLRKLQSQFTIEMLQAEVDLSIQFGRGDQALKLVERLVKESDRDLNSMWLGRIYFLLEKYELAEAQFEVAVKANGKDPGPWVALVQTLARAKQPERALAIIEEAKTAIEDKFAMLAVGQCYEILGNSDLAREAYQNALERAPENMEIRRRWIEFLLRSNSPGQAEVAQILAMYPTRAERQMAIDLFEKIVNQEPVLANQLEERWQLASLYQLLGEPTKSRGELRKILSSRKDDPRSLIAYIELSLQAKEFREAEIYLNALKKLAPDESSTADMEIQVLYARQKYTEIANLLKSIAAKKIESADPNASVRKQNWISRWYTTISNRLAQDKRLEDSDRFNIEAEEFYKNLSEEKSEELLTYAEFLAVTAHVDQSLQLMREHRNELTLGRIQRIVRAVMKNPRATPEQLAQCQELINSRENRPEESIPLALLSADLLSWRGDFKAAADKFREVLRVDKKNVILALSGGDHGEAMRLINLAIEIGGPMDAFFDTRGCVHLAAGNAEGAVSDFEKSANENENAERRFHTAVAYWRLKNVDAAKKALMRADELGIVENEFHPLERLTLNNLRKELNLPERSK